MSQESLLADFTASCAFGFSVIAQAHSTDATGHFVQTPAMRFFMTEAVVVRLHIAWERYLEESFLGYLMGLPSATGKRVATYLTAPSAEHARRVLVGTQKYVDWGNPEIVVRLANLYLEAGGPYSTALPAVQTDLFDLRVIRNAAAHLSSSATLELGKVALRKLGRAAPGVTTYDLVTAADSHSPGSTILQSLVSVVQATGAVISQG